MLSHLLRQALTVLAVMGLATASASANFERPLTSRIFQSGKYALMNTNGQVSITPAQAASAMAKIQPSYISGLIRLSPNENLTQDMISDYTEIRSSILAESPNAKFDVELNLDPDPKGATIPYKNGNTAVDHMKYINAQIEIDSFYFDFYSTAYKKHPVWVADVTKYAHSQGQLVGGNVFGGDTLPPNSDFVGFDNGPDGPDFLINETQVRELVGQAGSQGIEVLGHFNNNPQNGNSTFSCVFIDVWNATKQMEFLDYFIQEQQSLGFRFVLPVFFPQCPTAVAWDPLTNNVNSSYTVYDYLVSLAQEYDT